MCDNDTFYDSPDKFYQKKLDKQTNYVKEKDDGED